MLSCDWLPLHLPWYRHHQSHVTMKRHSMVLLLSLGTGKTGNLGAQRQGPAAFQQLRNKKYEVM